MEPPTSLLLAAKRSNTVRQVSLSRSSSLPNDDDDDDDEIRTTAMSEMTPTNSNANTDPASASEITIPEPEQQQQHQQQPEQQQQQQQQDILISVQEIECVDAAGRTGVYTGTIHPITKLPHTANSEGATTAANSTTGVMLYTSSESAGSSCDATASGVTVPAVCKYSGSWLNGQWHGVCSTSSTPAAAAAAAAAAASTTRKDGEEHNTAVSDEHADDDDNDSTSATSTTAATTLPVQTRNILLWQSGDAYSGDFCFGQRHGTGTFTWADGRVFSGDFVHNRRHGFGTYTWPDTGACYTGAFTANQRNGQGSYQDPVSDIDYTGSWKDGVYHGYGTYHWTDHSVSSDKSRRYVYAGNFRQGLPDGMGKEVLEADGTVRHFGLWKAGKPVLESNDNKNAGAPVYVVNDTMDGHVVEIDSDSHSSTTNGNQDTTLTATVAAPAAAPPPPSSIVETTVVQNQVWNDPLQKAEALYRGVWDVNAGHPTGNGNAIYTDPTHPIASYEGCFVDTDSSIGDSVHGIGSACAGLYHGHGRMVWRNGDVYTGAFVLGQRDGHGLYTWKDGRQYTGQFVANVRHGVGTYMFANLDLYEGEFVNGQRQGEGRFVFSDGSVYQGDWMAGLYHGHGTSVQTDGKTFVGGFYEGQAHGFGKETDAMGKLIYEGEWIRGVRADQVDAIAEEEAQCEQEHNKYRGNSVDVDNDIAFNRGRGSAKQVATPASKLATTTPVAIEAKASAAVVTPETADRGEDCKAVVDQPIADVHGNQGMYTGIVAKTTRKPHGTGRLVYADGRRIHEGFWTQGSKEGFGRCLFFPQGDFHEGEYRNNLRHGPGRYQWKDGRYFEGDYKDDLRHGKGLFTYPSGERYEGMFERGQRRGFGRFDFDDGKGYYEGEWAAGTYNGKGRLVWSNGSVYEGEFQNGVVHGQGVRKNPSGEIAEKGKWIEGKFQQPQVMPAPEPPSSESPPPLEATGDDGTDIHRPSSHCPATLVEQ